MTIITNTMSRRQLFEIGDSKWMKGLEKERVKILQQTYTKLQTDEQFNHFWEEFDYYCSTDIFSMMVYTDLLVQYP